MKRVELRHIPLRTYPWDRFTRWVPPLFLGLFLLQYAAITVDLWTDRRLFGNARWPDGLLIVFTAGSVLALAAASLPAQNVMLAGVVIAGLGSGVHALGAATGVPFGPLQFTERIGQMLFRPLPWAIPLLWIILILSSRGTARSILRPWRASKNYGFWLIGVTAALVLLLVIGLEPYATRVKGFWSWQPSRAQLHWYGAPWVNFLGWTVSTLMILAFATPMLINKKPGKPPPPDHRPLIVWLLLQMLFLNGAIVEKLGAAALADGITLLIVIGFWLYSQRTSELKP